MSYRRCLVVAGLLLLFAMPTAASADQSYSITGTRKLSGGGGSATQAASGQLDLRDDRSYSMTLDGLSTTGVWLREKNRIQFFGDPSVSTSLQKLTNLEAFFSTLLGRPLQLTGMKVSPEKITVSRSGDLRITNRIQYTLRPGPRGNAPFRLTEQSKLVARPLPQPLAEAPPAGPPG